MSGYGFICSPHVYEYKGVTFEVTPYSGPCQLTKKGNPFVRNTKKFYAMYTEFNALPKDEQEKYSVGGGCVRFEVKS